MPFSMHQICAPQFKRQLKALSNILQKGADFAEAKGMAPEELISARLAPDMFSLDRQVQSASDTVKGAVARLAQMDMPSYPDDEKTFPELQARIAKTLDFVASAPAERFEGSETRQVSMKIRGQDVTFPGQFYLFHFALPNLGFHTTTAYNILRHKGVELTKQDYLGARQPPA